MAYRLECKDNEGFTDQLTVGKTYSIIMFQSNSVMVKDDGGKERWFGEVKFRQLEYQD